MFADTEIMGSRKDEKVDIAINRVDGTDGKISCVVRTESFIEGKQNQFNLQNAIADQDYAPFNETIEFAAGES